MAEATPFQVTNLCASLAGSEVAITTMQSCGVHRTKVVGWGKERRVRTSIPNTGAG
jgi:hypothetical protein